MTIYIDDFLGMRTVSDYGNFYLFTGREVDILDTNGSLKIQYNRNRSYDYYTGRWLQRDPLGVNSINGTISITTSFGQFRDGMNLYEYVKSGVLQFLDPFGLMANPRFSIKEDYKITTSGLITNYTLSYDWECRRNAKGKLYVHIIKGVEIKSSSTFVGKATPVDIPRIPGAAFGIKFEVEIYSLVYDSWDCQPGECGEVKIAFVGLQDISRMGFFENASGKPIKIYEKTIYGIFTDWAIMRCCESRK